MSANKVLSWGLSFLAVLSSGCARIDVKADPFYADFFQKTSLIMTEDEIEIYLMLPDRESKLEFIRDFWKMRDPDPLTEENEARLEFERRIAFANQWFDRFGARRNLRATRKDAGWGWNTDRGRIFVVLGPPDLIMAPDSASTWEPCEEGRADRISRAVAWYYEKYQYFAYFGSSGFISGEASEILQVPDAPLVTRAKVSTFTDVMERAKLDMVSGEYRGLTARPFRFKAAYEHGSLRIAVPVKGLSFKEEDGRLTVRLEARIAVYRDRKREDVLTAAESFAFGEEEIVGMKAVEWTIPFRPAGRGEYLFDILLSCPTPGMTFRYRDLVKRKV